MLAKSRTDKLIGRDKYEITSIGIKIGDLFIQEDLSNEPVERNELFIGYTIHYLIGAIYGLIYVIINSLFFTLTFKYP